MLPTDRHLARRSLSGDRYAFDELHRRHVARVFHLLRRLTGDPTAAEDLTQDTFLAAYHALGGWRGDASFGTWLCGIAFRQYRNFRRRAGHEDAAGDCDVQAEADTQDRDPFLLCTRREARDLIEQAIGRLPISCRETFVLVRVEGFSYRDAADLQDVPLGTIQSRLSRAALLLRKDLAELAQSMAGSERPRHVQPGKENPDAL